MPRPVPVSVIAPLATVVAGLVLSSLRFRADDPAGGLAVGLGGVLLMLGLATWLTRLEERRATGSARRGSRKPSPAGATAAGERSRS